LDYDYNSSRAIEERNKSNLAFRYKKTKESYYYDSSSETTIGNL
jgi:hypothetical protein